MLDVKLVYFILLLLSVSSQSYASECVFNRKHQFTFTYTNCIYLPEKIAPQYGALKFISTTKYSYDLGIDYTYFFYKGIGFQIGLHQGFIPTDYYNNSQKVITEENFKSYGLSYLPFSSMKYNNLSVFYVDLPVKFLYQIILKSNLKVNFKVGTSLKSYFNYSQEGVSPISKKNNQGYEQKYVGQYHEINTIPKYRNFFPDLLLGLDFLISPKSNRSSIVLSLVYNKGFVQRFSGYYEYKNLGSQLDSRGLISYGSDYFGIGIGYSIFSKNKATKNPNYLFNNRF